MSTLGRESCGARLKSVPVGAPSLRFLQGRVRCCLYHGLVMPSGLHRTYGAHHLHFITWSCYRRLPFLELRAARDRFLSILEQTRQRYRFVVVGYVVMPEHIHLLSPNPRSELLPTVMQVLKQRTARALLPNEAHGIRVSANLFGDEPQRGHSGRRVSTTSMCGRRRSGWRSCRYMHRNPVKRGLVESPEQWRWSSYRFYLLEEVGPVQVNVGWTEISFRHRVA